MDLPEFNRKIELFRQFNSSFSESNPPEHLDPLITHEQLMTALEELQVAQEELWQ